MLNLLRKIGHSLSARLLLIFFLASLAMSITARYAFTLFQDTDYLRQIVGAHIALHSEYILNDMGSPPDIARAQAIVDKIPVDILIAGPDLSWSSSPNFYPLDAIPFGPISMLELGDASRSEVEAWVGQVKHVQFANFHEHFLLKIEDNGYEIVFASPRINDMPKPDYTTIIIGLIGVFVLFFCFFAVRWVFRPISWMQEGAARLGSGDLEYRIPTPRHDELGDLSREFNKMADDVQGMLEAKRQLMLAISHELRSPLTRSRVALELIDDGVARKNILEDIEEMERLITDLLESEALNTRHAILRRETAHLGELIEMVIAVDFSQRAENIESRVQFNIALNNIDVTRIRLLMRNLIDNALRYNPTGGPAINIMVSADSDSQVIVVQDHGPGIAPEHLKHVTEPFYRADAARTRATGGFGLGLYLCRRIVEAHGGELTINSNSSGTRVTVTLPVSDAC